MFALLLIALISPAHAGAAANDLREEVPLDAGQLRPGEQLAIATSTRAELRQAMDDVGHWIAEALLDGNTERLACLDGADHKLATLLSVTEDAERELRPSVLTGNHGRAMRETRRIQIAQLRGARLRDDAFECSQRVSQPLEPGPAPSYREEDVDLELDPLDAMSTGPW